MKNVSDQSFRETQNAQFISNNMFRKSRLLWNSVEKYHIARQATDDNMAHAHYLLNKATETPTICNTYCFSIAKMVTRTRHNITLYVHYLSCFTLHNISIQALASVDMITKRTLTVKCRDSLLGTVARLRARGFGFDSRQGKDPISLPFDMYRRTFPVIKRLGPEVGRFPPSCSKVKNEWCCTTNAPIRLAAVDTDKFTFN